MNSPLLNVTKEDIERSPKLRESLLDIKNGRSKMLLQNKNYGEINKLDQERKISPSGAFNGGPENDQPFWHSDARVQQERQEEATRHNTDLYSDYAADPLDIGMDKNELL